MFDAVLIGSSFERIVAMKTAALETRRVLISRETHRYPMGEQFTTMLRIVSPDFVLIDLSDPVSARECVLAAASLRTIGIIGVGDPGPFNDLGSVPRMVGTIPFPPEAPELLAAIDEAVHWTRTSPEKNLIAFLPSKAGSGASTVALNTAIGLAQRRRRVLLIEADLRSGVLADVMNVHPLYSIQHVLQRSADMDHFMIDRAVAQAGGVDFLLSNRDLTAHVPLWADYFRLLDVVRSRYDDVIVDMPELVNPATREIVQRAKLVFNVCTPEILSLRLARQRCMELDEWGVPERRVRIILNRWHQHESRPEDIERQLNRPVAKVIPNDYSSVRSALSAGRAVSATCATGRAFQEFAAELAGEEFDAEGNASIANQVRRLFGRA